MKRKFFIISMVVVLIGSAAISFFASGDDNKTERAKRKLVDTRIDNNKYWKKMASEGLATLNPDVRVEKAVYLGSRIDALSVALVDSPDVPVTDEASTQSENSIFVNPKDPYNVLNSNNSTNISASTLYGANDLYSMDGSETWDGEIFGAGGSNSGDPTTAISNTGRWFVGFITNSYGQGVSYSDDQGATWTDVLVANTGGAQVLDKNHMWIDNSSVSPYDGRLHNAWTPLGGSSSLNDEIAYSWSDGGTNWSAPVAISTAVNAGSHNQGVNLNSGPNGEVYGVWAIYDTWPQDEPALGFARSYNGGVTWDPATRIIQNIRGIRNSETSKNQRVNSFPSMAVDRSNGPFSGNIYVVWANIGVPGINTGNDIDVYMIKSSDDGDTWSDPIRVNQDPAGLGKEHYFPWIACDPVTGSLHVVFYDDRNVASNQCEVFCANSFDAGETWEDFRVSDVSFTPSPIPGLASGYFGDYLGITAHSGMVYPVWTDNRTGSAMTYCSPYVINLLPAPKNLEGELVFESGAVNLIWNFAGHENFEHFNIYRDETVIGTTTDTVFTDLLPDYGIYAYAVSAYFSDGNESIPASLTMQWGDAHISVNPEEIYAHLAPGETTTKQLIIYNVGELELQYDITQFVPSDSKNSREYCEADGGCDEYISNVSLGDIDNSSDCGEYQDFTDISATLLGGSVYELVVTNGNPYFGDQCGAWIDWNQNEEFEAGEEIAIEGTPGEGPYTATIIPPTDAPAGETRMRVRILYTGDVLPCGTTQYGEVEDYSIMLINWFAVTPVGGNIAAGDSAVIVVTLNAEMLEKGNYYAEIIIDNNDPDQNEVIVPVYLTVNDLEAEASASAAGVCEGGEVQVFATVQGGAGTISYNWTSMPEGYFSNEQNPVFENLTQNTTFKVEVTDSLGSVFVSAPEVMVYAFPEVTLGEDTSLCSYNTLMLDAGTQPNSTFLWSTGATTQTVELNGEVLGVGTHEIWVEVTNEHECSSTASVDVTFKDCTGLEEIENLKNINIFPNPSNGNFTVELNAFKMVNLNITVFDANGMMVVPKRTITFNGQHKENINLNHVSKGVYNLFIFDNNHIITRKLVIN